MNFEATQHVLVRKSALFLFLATAIGTAIRPLVAEQSINFTFMGLANTVLMALMYAFLRYTKPNRYGAYVVFVCGFISLIPLMLFSGGVNSQFAVVLPVIPLLACLLISALAAWLVTAFVIFLVVMMRLVEDSLPNFALEQVSMQKTNARTFWICMTCLLCATFANEFYRLNRRLGRKLQFQASIDSLTGVNNRRTVIACLDEAIIEGIEDNQWLTVMMIDADKFKQINDSYGHLVGDECLKKMADTLQKNMRSKTDTVGRYGGEEFLAVLPGVDQTAAHCIAETIRHAIKDIHFEYKGQKINISATIGYCSMPVTDMQDGERFLSMADEALFAGKQSGRNRVMGAEQSDYLAAHV